MNVEGLRCWGNVCVRPWARKCLASAPTVGLSMDRPASAVVVDCVWWLLACDFEICAAHTPGPRCGHGAWREECADEGFQPCFMWRGDARGRIPFSSPNNRRKRDNLQQTRGGPRSLHSLQGGEAEQCAFRQGSQVGHLSHNQREQLGIYDLGRKGLSTPHVS